MSAAETIQQFKAWQNHWWASDLLVMDTETTDLDGEVIEVAFVQLDGKVIFNERIRPQGKVSPGAREVHGITDADLARCHDFAYWWPRIRRLICRHTVLVYNAAFDFKALDNSLAAVRPGYYKGEPGATDPYSADYWVMEMARKKAQCVMEAYSPLGGWWSDWHGDYRWVKLTEACKQRGVDLSDLQAHSAVGDALATARLIRACAELNPEDFPWIGREELGANV